MKGKPLINESLLQKISKPQTFVVRNKPQACKSFKKDKSNLHLNFVEEPSHLDLTHFLDLLQKCIDENLQLDR